MLREFNASPLLIQGQGGIFDVKLDGKLIYSKWDKGRFPEPYEVFAAIRAATASAKK